MCGGGRCGVCGDGYLHHVNLIITGDVNSCDTWTIYYCADHGSL